MNFGFQAGFLISLLIGVQIPAFSEGIGLEQVIREVSTQSDSVKMMQETLTRSRQAIKEQWAAALPSVSANVFTGRYFGLGMGSSGFSVPNNISPTDPLTLASLSQMFKTPEATDAPLYNTSLSVSQTIYTFGKIGAAVKVARFYAMSNQLNYGRGIQQLQLLGLDAFYRVVLLDMSLSIMERSLERKKELDDFLTRNFNLGSGSKAQILATKADLVSIYPEIIKARQDATTARMQLCFLMGRSTTDSIKIDTSSVMPSLLAMQLPSKDSALKTAIENRNDLHSIDYLKKANEGGVKIYQAMCLPSISGLLTMGTSSDSLKKLFGKNQNTWRVGIGLNWTLFDGFQSSAKAQQYLSDSRKLQTAYNSIRKSIEIEIDGALTECIAADSNIICFT